MMSTTRMAEPPRTADMGRSWRVRMGFVVVEPTLIDDEAVDEDGAPGFVERLARMERMPSAKAEMIVGAVRSKVISPAVATAPAPMGRT